MATWDIFLVQISGGVATSAVVSYIPFCGLYDVRGLLYACLLGGRVIPLLRKPRRSYAESVKQKK